MATNVNAFVAAAQSGNPRRKLASKDVNTLIRLGTILSRGTNSSFDPNLLSSKTLASVLSHIRLLERNGVTIDEVSLVNNLHKTLDSLRTHYKNEPLKDSYKFQIGSTIKRLFPNAAINLSRYNKNRGDETTRISSPRFMSNVRLIIESASKIVGDAYNSMNDVSIYDTSLVILLTVSTSLRISEVLQLKMADITEILNRRPINIKTKGPVLMRIIMTNNLLEVVLRAIQKQRPKVIDYINNQTLIASSANKGKMIERLSKDFIILTSESYMRRRLKELAAPVIKLADTGGGNQRTGRKEKYDVIGFNVFRKATTTILVSGGGHDVAQAINNHSNLNTTLRHYNVQSVQANEDAFAELERMRETMFPQPLITANDVRLRTIREQQQQQIPPPPSGRQSPPARQWQQPPPPQRSINFNYSDDEDNAFADEIVEETDVHMREDYRIPETPPPSVLTVNNELDDGAGDGIATTATGLSSSSFYYNNTPQRPSARRF